jgi:hypothetical protein
MNNKVFKQLMVILVLGVQSSIFACSVTLTNDIENPVQVVEKENKYDPVEIEPNETRLIGSNEYHANFYLYESIDNEWVLKYIVDQVSCSGTGNQDIMVTDIINNTGNIAEHFTVTTANEMAPAPCCNH